MFSRITKFGFCACLVVGLIVGTTTGCGGNDTQAQKLETPEGIDWDAIEAEGSEMAATQEVGE